MSRTTSTTRSVGAPRPARRFVRLTVLGVLGTVLATGSMAYWTAGRSEGAATAAAGSVQAVRVTDARFTRQLRPNGPAVPVTVTVSNPNGFDVQITAAAVRSITSDTVGCGAASAPTGVVLDLTKLRGAVAANSTANFTASASMSEESVSACQGARFAASIEVEVRQ